MSDEMAAMAAAGKVLKRDLVCVKRDLERYSIQLWLRQAKFSKVGPIAT